MLIAEVLHPEVSCVRIASQDPDSGAKVTDERGELRIIGSARGLFDPKVKVPEGSDHQRAVRGTEQKMVKDGSRAQSWRASFNLEIGVAADDAVHVLSSSQRDQVVISWVSADPRYLLRIRYEVRYGLDGFHEDAGLVNAQVTAEPVSAEDSSQLIDEPRADGEPDDLMQRRAHDLCRYTGRLDGAADQDVRVRDEPQRDRRRSWRILSSSSEAIA